MRGAADGHRGRGGRGGIIPACAGSSRDLVDEGRDGPSRYGIIPACAGSSDSEAINYGLTREGSSPRVRGAVAARVVVYRVHGIIPACAGSRPCRTTRTSACRDHPRVCGEQPLCARRAMTDSGSSPRVRGAGVLGPPAARADGIIPACAGSRLEIRS